MKKIVFLSIFVLSILLSKAQTNVYHPFPNSNSTWTQIFAPSTGGYQISQYGIFGDTIVGAYTYHKLYIRSVNPCISPDTMKVSNSSWMGAIREDNFKRIYYYTPNHSNCDSVRKIYDFSKQMPGDTVVFSTGTFNSCYQAPYLIISSVDSILIKNSYRKQYHFSQETWIEGIGSTRGLLSAISPQLTCSCINRLSCNLQNDTLYYFSNAAAPFNYCLCNYPDEIKNYAINRTFKATPNPFSNQTKLYFDETLINATLILSNSLGQQVKQIKNITGQTITLQRDNLPNGVYFINIIEGNKIIASSKLIIAD